MHLVYFGRNYTNAQKKSPTQQRADDTTNCYIICYSVTRKILRTTDNFIFNIAIANDGYSKDKLTHLIRDFYPTLYRSSEMRF